MTPIFIPQLRIVSTMGLLTLVFGSVLAMLFLCGGGYLLYNRYFKKPPEDIMMELAGELGIRYYPREEGKPPFSTGTYSGRGVTLDLMNEKGYMDRWHPHSRVVVSVSKDVRDTHIVAYRGRFYSRKLGEVDVNNTKFTSKYILLSSAPKKAERLITPDVAGWVVKLDMPFVLSDGHAVFHQEKHFDDEERVKHIIDALVYVATMAERLR